jgi:outer membrane receptor for ferric coprogen and ferric-rhodotorulic acid
VDASGKPIDPREGEQYELGPGVSFGGRLTAAALFRIAESRAQSVQRTASSSAGQVRSRAETVLSAA